MKTEYTSEDLLKFGVVLAAGIRQASQESGVGGSDEFIRGLMSAGFLAEQISGGEAKFEDAARRAFPEFRKVLLIPVFRERRADIEGKKFVVVKGGSEEQTSTVAWAASNLLEAWADEYLLKQSDVVEIAAIAVVAAICTLNLPENRERALDVSMNIIERSARKKEELQDIDLFGDVES